MNILYTWIYLILNNLNWIYRICSKWMALIQPWREYDERKKYDKIISISCNVRLVQRKSDIRTVKRRFPQNFIHAIEIITPFQIRVHINVAIDIIHILKCICSHNIFITVYRTLLCVTNLICHAGHMSRSRFVETSINYATSCRPTRRNKK